MTNFTSIYDKFLSKITDFSIAKLDQAVLEDDLKRRVISALAYFPELPEDKKVYMESEVDATFALPLTLEEQEIIANLMVINYLDKYIISEDNMRVQLNSKDYKQYSQASLLKELKDLKSVYLSDVDAMKNAYDFRMMYQRKREKKNG